jgi:hypothetical protein
LIAIPDTAADIDGPWLERALAPRYPGVSVSGVEIIDRTEMTNSHARLAVTYRDDVGAPSSMFCKLLPASEKRRDLIAQTGMGPREVRFYNDIAPHTKLRVPSCFVALHDEADEAFILLIEDLIASQCTISDGSIGLDPDAAALALEDLADLHVRFADRAVREAQAPWVPAPMESDYGSVMLQHSLDKHRDRLTPCFAEHAELYIAHRPALHARWHEGPHTVIHGDTHIGNLFLDGNRTGFLDWGIINVSTPMRDVSYLMLMAMSIEDRRAHERDLLRHYLDVQHANGGPKISFDDAWHSHRLQAAYVVPACCQIVMFPDNEDPARRKFAQAFLGRAEAALEDLEVRAALRESLGI